MNYLAATIQKYRSKGIIVDTNLLILYFVGGFDISYIEKFQRVKNKGYTKEDYEALVRLLSCFDRLLVTPHIIAEVSNLSFKDETSSGFVGYFKSVMDLLLKADEQYIHKDILLRMPHCAKFGFTDMSIVEFAQQEDLPVITDDFKLHGLLTNAGVASINMDVIRALA